MINNLLVIIVLYKTKLEDSLSFNSLVKSSDFKKNNISFYIYDNSPDEDQDVYFFNDIDFFYEKDYENSGISKAYNKAAAYAKSKGKEWLLLLDQDSSIPADFIVKLEESVNEYSGQILFAPILKHNNLILSPCHFKLMKGSAMKLVSPGIRSLKDKSIFNSGILVKLSSFLKVGGYNENVPLDFSDHSFIHRMRNITSEFVVMPIEIDHQLSSFSQNYDVILRRFIQYCQGVLNYHQFEEKSGLLLVWTFLRAFKLSLQFKNRVFLDVFFKAMKER